MRRFRYTVHNVFGHPLMEIFYLLGMRKTAAWVHDATLPKSWREDYDNSWDVGEQSDE